MHNRSLILAVLVIGLAAGATGIALTRWLPGTPADAASTADEVVIAHPLWAVDPTDDRALAAYATDIFVGRIVAVSGTVGAPTSTPGEELPQTQFAVRVIHVIKGKASGTVTVNQVGGHDTVMAFDPTTRRAMRRTRLVLIEGDSLLKTGDTALFLTGYVPERNWYQIVAAGYGHLRAATQVEREQVTSRFTRASHGPGTSRDR